MIYYDSLKKLAITTATILFCCSTSLATILIYPYNGDIRIRNKASQWRTTKKQSILSYGDSVRTGQTSECMVRFDKDCYLIAKASTLFTIASSSDSSFPLSDHEKNSSASEINLIEGSIVVRLSSNRTSSYFATNSNSVFGGIKSSRKKTPVLFAVKATNGKDVWSIYSGKLNLIARNPVEGSLSISGQESISLATGAQMSRKDVFKVQPDSFVKKILKAQYQSLNNIEQIHNALLKRTVNQNIQPLRNMSYNLLAKGQQYHNTITENSKEFPSHQSDTAINLSSAMSTCLSHLEGRIQDGYFTKHTAFTVISKKAPSEESKETVKLVQLQLLSKRVTEIRNSVNSNSRLQNKIHKGESTNNRTLTELRLISRQIAAIIGSEPSLSVKTMANNLLRNISAIEGKF